MERKLPMPQIVFATAFDHYAVQAFEVNAVDYVLKPFDKARIARAAATREENGGRARVARRSAGGAGGPAGRGQCEAAAAGAREAAGEIAVAHDSD